MNTLCEFLSPTNLNEFHLIDFTKPKIQIATAGIKVSPKR